MKHTSLFLLLTFLLGLTACSKSSGKVLMNYEQSLVRADSLVQCGAADSAQISYVTLLMGINTSCAMPRGYRKTR